MGDPKDMKLLREELDDLTMIEDVLSEQAKQWRERRNIITAIDELKRKIADHRRFLADQGERPLA